MAVDLKRALLLVYQPESEWNRIVADPNALSTMRNTLGVLVGVATVVSTLGYLFVRHVGASFLYVVLHSILFAMGRLLCPVAAYAVLRNASASDLDRARLLAGYGSMPISLAGVLEILPIPFARWLWALSGLGLAYMTLATAMTPVLGTSSEQGGRLARAASVALALPIVAFDLLRHVCP